MKIRIGLFAGVLGAALLAGSTANATPTLVGTTTDPTGINNLVVDGTTYDATFSTTTLNSFTFGSTLSVDAASALASALTSLDVTNLENSSVSIGFVLDVDNNLNNFDIAYCATTCTMWGPNTGHNFYLGQIADEFYVEAADFSVATSAVPEPSSLPMLLAGLGMIGGAFCFRRKKVLGRV